MGDPTFPPVPRTLRDPSALAGRRALLDARSELGAFAAGLRRPGLEVPDLDPINGTAGVRLLFLLEKPGPMTSPTRTGRRAGSGLISPDNDDPTAEATFGFLRRAGVDRRHIAVWNVIPWWNGTIRVTAAEHREGLAALGALLDRLPDLRGAVLVGNRAAAAEDAVRARGLLVVRSPHPSPQVRAARPELWHTIPGRWEEAARAADACGGSL